MWFSPLGQRCLLLFSSVFLPMNFFFLFTFVILSLVSYYLQSPPHGSIIFLLFCESVSCVSPSLPSYSLFLLHCACFSPLSLSFLCKWAFQFVHLCTQSIIWTPSQIPRCPSGGQTQHQTESRLRVLLKTGKMKRARTRAGPLLKDYWF